MVHIDAGKYKYDLICIGTAIVDSIIKGFDPEPVSDTGFRAESCSLNPGGEAVNESVAAAKLGLSAAILCFLGSDSAGRIIEQTLSESNVITDLVIHLDEHQTPVTTMFVNKDGSRKSITNIAHRYNFHPEQYLSYLDDTRAVVLGSLFRAPFDDPDIIYEVLKYAKEQGVLTFADTKLPNFSFLTLDDVVPALPLIDYITPNEDEARYYSGKDTPEAMADVFLEKGAKNVIIKLGAKGCFFKNEDHKISLPACHINAADATGAGDNFIAGFVSEILRGSPEGEALCFANACGAICTGAIGAGTALKDRGQVLEFLKHQYN